MPITVDTHLHSSYSGDSEASMEEMIQKAVKLGLKNICFTEHIDLDFPVLPEVPADTFSLNADAFLYELLGYKEKYADQIEVLFGIECGMQPHLSKENARFVKEHEYDFVIGSVHVLDGADPYYPSFYETHSEEESIRMYFDTIYKSIRTFGNFDSLGHMDYVVRYCQKMGQTYDPAKYMDQIDNILDLLIDREKALELNTGSFRSGMAEANPCKTILKRYREKGGELITVGSDAHTVADVGSGLDKATEILTDCGFKYYTVFSGRIPIMKRL